jgi:hypothetical protein
MIVQSDFEHASHRKALDYAKGFSDMIKRELLVREDDII